MKRKPTFSTYIGSISSGTMRPEDLIPTFADELASLLKKCRVDHETRKAHTVLVNAINKLTSKSAHPSKETGFDYNSELADDFVTKLFDALEHYAPPYTYFGAHEGDGADYGFWPHNIDDEDIIQ